MKKNDCFPMTADRLGADLEGVCIHEGMPVFVPGLLPGESATVRIVKAEKRYAFGRMETAPDPASPDRRDPGCPSWPRCGGCTGRHMSYEATLAAKRQQVEDCFRRIAGIDAEVLPVLGMDRPCGYRNKTSLPAGGTADAPVLGFYAPRSHAVIPAESCPNAMPPANELTKAFLGWMKMFHVEPYREDTRRGLIRHLVIRVNRKGESMVTVAANGGSLPHAKELTDALVPLGTVSLWMNENRADTNVILSEKFHLIYGKETLTDELCGLRFELSPASFFQVNPEQTEKLYRTAVDYAGLKPTDRLCDVYCGAGTITLTMARHCREAVGIEIVPAAVENAKRNAVLNGIGNAVFHAGKAEELLPRMVADGLRPDVIVVDPPRKGLDPAVIRAMAQAGPDRLVYVSCNPATLARDAGLLKEEGYLIRRVQPVDMFCWTSGVENVVRFDRETGTDAG
ncbi:MAG: 23S rRNA (uracil(1939)-C(5))-methyltransferase RlmD [Clostridiales bacterium]|nr:23S rRNA (uracil(1939)-C(5))-methyltransferase RlmD [Clostridiales bacterium]